MEATAKNTALVVGGGPAGMQASLVLAERGHHVVLVDAAPALGGLFPLLDNQFPTQSCGVCFMACSNPTYCPFVQCELHENVEVVANARVAEVTGQAGAFRVKVRCEPSSVDRDKCTDCGACEAVCPVEVPREFGDGLETRKAIYRCYPKAVGKGYIVDRAACTRCGKCVDACDARAVNLDAAAEERWIDAGAVVLAPGAAPFRVEKKGEFGFGRYPNVLSAVKFERMLSAGSPSSGRAVRPSDGKNPQSIAFVQCVGSRDPASNRPHCSSVCCMFTLKQALFAKARHPETRVAVFYMDLRAFGKDYERYLREAEAAGIEFIRAMPSVVRQEPATGDLTLAVSGTGNGLREEKFSLVVLASGFERSEETGRLCAAFGLESDAAGLSAGAEFSPCATAVPGVFAAGAFRAPKDIPESTVDGSAAAALAARLLERLTAAGAPDCPTPADFRDEAPAVGVVLCRCEGYNAGKVDFEALAKAAAALPGVAFVEQVEHACSKLGMNEIRGVFAEKEPNRLVLATCSHRIVQDLYEHMFKQMGVHTGVLEVADLRAVCRAEDVGLATATVASSVRTANATQFAAPVRRSVHDNVLVVGGGAAGMTTSLALADLGHTVHLVEKESELGGNLRTSAFTLWGNDPRALAAELSGRVAAHPSIRVYTGARPAASEGSVGSFRTTVDTPEGPVEILHGAVALATGAREVKPKAYGYGQNPRIVTQKELEAKLASGEFTGGRVVMIQCVESREDGEGCRPYCSRVCCTHAVKNAREILRRAPDSQVTVLYRDLRTYGNFERAYQAARAEGVLFTAFDLASRPEVSADGGRLTVSYLEPSLGAKERIEADWLVLSVGMAPDAAEAKRLSALFGVEADAAGFFIEKNAKAATTDFVRPGVYMAGLAHAPKHIEESIAQAEAAAGRLSALLARGELTAPANRSFVVEKLCSRCGLCVEACPYGARSLDYETNVAKVDEIVCRACGACATVCPNKAARLYGTVPAQVLAALDELL